MCIARRVRFLYVVVCVILVLRPLGNLVWGSCSYASRGRFPSTFNNGIVIIIYASKVFLTGVLSQGELYDLFIRLFR